MYRLEGVIYKPDMSLLLGGAGLSASSYIGLNNYSYRYL